ncbi:hypothetical protein Droror1_Dr00014655 [Drosera rotundifolia]
MASEAALPPSQPASKNDAAFTIHTGDEDETNDHPIEQVRLTVTTEDDPTTPALTFRTWVIGITSCVVLSFLNQFFGYRYNSISIGALSAQIVVLPIGRFMATVLPTRKLKFPFTNWSFTMNPGPFNLKEHVLITIFANCGAGGVYAIDIVTIVKALYHRSLNIYVAFLLSLTTQMLGYGWAGIFRKHLVDSPYMWWPANLVQVSLFRTLHEKDARKKKSLTRLQFFLIILICSFAYYIVPGYLFPSIGAISIACYIWKDSVLAQQLGSGVFGLGIGSLTFDWSAVSSFVGNPLANPGFAIVNTMVGFFVILYVLQPIFYWSNLFEAKRFPFISSKTFDYTGHRYNVSRIVDGHTFSLDIAAYDSYSKIYLSVFFAFTYGLGFATLTATISHVALFYGKTIWGSWKRTTSAVESQHYDVHTRIMKKNYPEVPQWWFIAILSSMFALSLYACESFGKQLQLPWWGLILACAIAFVFTLPIGIITATTNNQPGLNIITELIIGYLYPGKPLANVAFKTYGYISMTQAVSFVQDFKLGHYMKIPPKSMFYAQLVGTVISASVYFATAWYLLSSIHDICDSSKLPDGSPWTCPGSNVFYSASIIWGVVGPMRMFTKHGNYGTMNYFFLIGLLAPVPVWLLSRKYPEKKWIKLINMPVLLSSTGAMPPGRAINYLSWGAVGLFFNVYVFRKHKAWWARYNYIMAAALDAGVAFMGILVFFTLQSDNVFGPTWWGLEVDDHCSLGTCPTAPGIVVDGCPVF